MNILEDETRITIHVCQQILVQLYVRYMVEDQHLSYVRYMVHHLIKEIDKVEVRKLLIESFSIFQKGHMAQLTYI